MTATASIKWEADDSRVQAVHNRMVKDMATLKEEIRRLKAEAKDTSNTWESGLKRTAAKQQENTTLTQRMEGAMRSATTTAITGAAGMVGGYVTVNAIVGRVLQGYDAWQQRLDRLSEKHTKFTDSLVEGLGKAGMIMQGPEIERALDSMTGGTREQRLTAFNAVVETAPQVDLKRQLEIAGAVAQQAPARGKGLQQFAQLAGTFEAPGRSADDIVDLAAFVSAKGGDNAQRLANDKWQRTIKQLTSSGAASLEEATALAVVAGEENISSETISQLAATAGKSQDPRAALQRALARPARGSEISRINPQALARLTAEAKEATSGNLATRELQALGGFVSGAEALSAQRVAEMADLPASRANAMENAQRLRAIDAVRAGAARRGVGAQIFTEASMPIEAMHEMVGGRALMGNQTRAESLIEFGVNTGNITKQEADAFRKQEALVTEQIKALRANTDAIHQRSGRNIDAHTE